MPKTGVVDFRARHKRAACSATHVKALADVIGAAVSIWWHPYLVPATPEHLQRIDELNPYTAPQKFTDLDGEVQALVKVLADYLDAGECLHPQADRDVDALLKDAVMAICRPPAGAPQKMSGKEAYAARARVAGFTEEEIAEELKDWEPPPSPSTPPPA
jgi:hypothetical protein